MAFNPAPYLITIGRGNNAKQYLPVAARIMWMHEDRPEWSYDTTLLQSEPIAIVRCAIFDDAGRQLASSHGTATPAPNAVYSGREVEKAETASIGRVLALLGFGTQFVGVEEFDDTTDEHLADSPIEQPNRFDAQRVNQPPPARQQQQGGRPADGDTMEFTTLRVEVVARANNQTMMILKSIDDEAVRASLFTRELLRPFVTPTVYDSLEVPGTVVSLDDVLFVRATANRGYWNASSIEYANVQ